MARTKRTIFGHFKEKIKGPVEYRHSNPLKRKCGDAMMFESPGYAGKVFTIQSVREVTREILGNTFVFTDYDLDEGVKLRYNDGNLLLLEKAGEFEYDKEFHEEVLGSESNDLLHTDYKDEEHQYWRVNDVSTPHEAKALTISDKDGNGTVEPEEVVPP